MFLLLQFSQITTYSHIIVDHNNLLRKVVSLNIYLKIFSCGDILCYNNNKKNNLPEIQNAELS